MISSRNKYIQELCSCVELVVRGWKSAVAGKGTDSVLSKGKSRNEVISVSKKFRANCRIAEANCALV